MPSVTQETPPPVPSPKKRRRDGDDSITADNNNANRQFQPYANSALQPGVFLADFSARSSSPSLHNHTHIPRTTLYDDGATLHYHHVPPALRKVIPLQAFKRIRTIDNKEGVVRVVSSSPSTAPQTRPTSPISQDELHQRTSHDRPTSAPPSNLAPALMMSRCHVCSRKPTKKSDLDSFADCEGCGQRTCFICIRQCLGWRPHSLRDDMPGSDRPKGRVSLGAMSTDSFTMEDATESTDTNENDGRQCGREGNHDYTPTPHRLEDSDGWAAKGKHRQMVCSKCCVETGKDGDVVCLGCLPFVEG